jgi:hypothetical protein
MGADWYTCTGISAIGFIVKEKAWTDAMSTAVREQSEKVQFATFIDRGKLAVFVYLKGSATRNEISMVGPYEIQRDYRQCAITQNDSLYRSFDLQQRAEIADFKGALFGSYIPTFFQITTCDEFAVNTTPCELRDALELDDEDDDDDE